MKKIFSTIMMLTMMVALSSSTCSGSSDDDEINGGNPSKGQMTMKVDGESFYAVNCTAEQTKRNGMYLCVNAVTDPNFPLKGHELTVHISPSKVSELIEGEVFGINRLSVQEFRRPTEISVNTYDWRDLEGDITIKRITSMEMTIQINDLLLEHEITRVQHTISGTAILNSGVYDSKGNLLSFEDAIN